MSGFDFEMPPGSRVAILFVPGFAGDRNESRDLYKNFVQYLSNLGIASFRYDPVGIGQSVVGKVPPVYGDWVADVEKHLELLAIKGFERVGVLAFSLGASVVVEALEDPNLNDLVDAIALWAPTLNPEEDMLKRYIANGDYDKAIAGQLVKGGVGITKAMLDSLAFNRLTEADMRYQPALICHSLQDKLIPFNSSARVLEQFPNAQPIQIIRDGAGHSFRRGNDLSPRIEVYQSTAQFFKDYLS